MLELRQSSLCYSVSWCRMLVRLVSQSFVTSRPCHQQQSFEPGYFCCKNAFSVFFGHQHFELYNNILKYEVFT